MPQVFVAAGSNFEPGRHLDCAVSELERAFPDLRCSPRYRSAAADGAAGEFINMVVGFTTALPPLKVQELLKAVEAHCGRSRNESHQVELDLDLLLYGDLVCMDEGLEIPRPELLTRPYMMGPLADLAPGLKHPTANLTIAELWERLGSSHQPLERLS